MLSLLLSILLLVPSLAIVLTLVLRRPRLSEYLNLAASVICLLVVLPLPYLSLHGPYYFWNDFFIVDAMGAWVLLCVGIVYSLASMYTIGYMRMLQIDNRLYYFYALFAAFALTMFMAPLMNNIAVYWIAIEMTTLISTFLVSFVKAPESVEAAWKYIIIVSAGISLALLGIIFFYWGGTWVLGPTYALTWPMLGAIAAKIHPGLLSLAFFLVLIGFGTKVGLAPMHTWLPDAHSEGPVPVSAMLSGALLNVAMLGIVRFVAILHHTTIALRVSTAMVVLGIVSLGVAGLFIARQQDVKRLMAYSSVEHMGVLALGFGFGGPIACAGALYHMLGHSLNKSLMFFGAGNVMHTYHTKQMGIIRGVFKKLPRSSVLWLAGAIAITGSPPFALFLSEITVLRGGMASANPWAVFVMALLLILIFCGFLNHFWAMYFSPAEAEVESEAPHRTQLSPWCVLPMVVPLVALLILGLWWPEALWRYFMLINAQLEML